MFAPVTYCQEVFSNKRLEKRGLPLEGTGADPGFSERGFGQTSAYIIIVIVVQQVLYHKKKYGQNSCVCFILGGSTEPTKPPLDPPRGKIKVKVVVYYVSEGVTDKFWPLSTILKASVNGNNLHFRFPYAFHKVH